MKGTSTTSSSLEVATSTSSSSPVFTGAATSGRSVNMGVSAVVALGVSFFCMGMGL